MYLFLKGFRGLYRGFSSTVLREVSLDTIKLRYIYQNRFKLAVDGFASCSGVQLGDYIDYSNGCPCSI